MEVFNSNDMQHTLTAQYYSALPFYQKVNATVFSTKKVSRNVKHL